MVKIILSIKINNKVKIQYYSYGIKLFFKKNNKWYLLKFNEYESELLKKAINYLCELK